MFDHILVPIDQSPCAQTALATALQIAKANNAALTICHVVDLTKFGSVAVDAATPPGSSLDLQEAAGAAVLAQADQQARTMGVTVRTIELHGEPVSEIALSAEEYGADAIFMGTHGFRGLARLVLGSVTQGVMRTAHVPVVMLRDEREPLVGQRAPFTNILVAYDGTEHAERALDAARELYGAYGGELSICYVVDLTQTLSIVGTAYLAPDEVIDALTAQGRSALEVATGRMNGARVKTFLRSGRPDDEILACAGEAGADLIILGSHGRRGLTRLVLGSVSESVMKRASIPVAVVGGKTKGSRGRTSRAAKVEVFL